MLTIDFKVDCRSCGEALEVELSSLRQIIIVKPCFDVY